MIGFNPAELHWLYGLVRLRPSVTEVNVERRSEWLVAHVHLKDPISIEVISRNDDGRIETEVEANRV